MSEIEKQVTPQWGANKEIKDGNYDKALAVKCINGTFVGTKAENVISYKGIPFVGQQPVGNLRWKAPVDVTPDSGVYEAYYFPKAACQDKSIIQYQGEDCLYLNVWRSDEVALPLTGGAGKGAPVMVWIHGGAFSGGGTNIELFDCANLAKEHPDVIFVTVQYRLGPLGFLHLSHLPDGKDYPDAQNLGLLDQQMALKWVHENIAAFGGDPGNVTIWGESAGAGSVTMQPLIKGSQQYFKKVIAQSGAPCQTSSREEAIEAANDFIEGLGCKTVADMMKFSADELIAAAGETVALRLFPERDGRIMPLDPWKEYENGVAKDIVFLQGCNKDEMNCFVADWQVENFKVWVADRKTKKFAHLLTEEEKAKVESYCKEGAVEDWEPDSRLFSHSWFIDGSIKLAESQTIGGGKSYTYYYRVESSDPIRKSAHFEEVPIVFAHPEFVDGRPYDPTFSKAMRQMWVQFARTGCPSPDWPLYDLKDKQVMVLDEFDIHPAKESEVKIVDWERTYFLTKYYML